jgi:hypothetical protein
MSAKKIIANDGSSAPAPSELAQLQEIIFGSAQRQLQSQVETLSAALDTRFSKLNLHLDEQFSLLQKQLASTAAEFEKKINAVATEEQENTQRLTAMTERLSSDIEIAETTAKSDMDNLQAHLLKELEATDKQFNQQITHLLAKLEAVTAELSTSKTDRKTLAALLSTMANNLATD